VKDEEGKKKEVRGKRKAPDPIRSFLFIMSSWTKRLQSLAADRRD